MPLHALRRWFARHSASGVLGLALGLALILGGAQVAAACHEIAHVAAASDTRDLHAGASHDCPTCLLAAAIGGAATAPTAAVFVAPDAALAAPGVAAREFTPRFEHAYASRAPPQASVTTA